MERDVTLLNFIYSTVNAGKTANLLMRAHSCNERSIPFMMLVPSIASKRDGVAQVASRVGFKHEATPLKEHSSLFEIVSEEHTRRELKVVFVDESQFLNKLQVYDLTRVADELGVPVFAYGLRTDFKGNPFEGSIYLMAWADHIEEVATFSPCAEKATFNMKVDQEGKKISDGESVSPGFDYLPVSRREFGLSP